MPVATISIAEYILPCLNRTIGYAERLVKDIPADKFAFMPHPQMNHPAFCLGHLSLYPARVLTLIDRTDLIREKPGFPELFAMGVQCIQKDGHYPAKDDIWEHYHESYQSVVQALPNVPDELFSRPNPMEGRMREMFPLIGIAVNFLLNNHHMMHLGQVSAWRRAIGMGPAM